MHQYRITKYNPIYRDNNGFFKHDEWTSVTDTNIFNKSSSITFNDYMVIENDYINVVKHIMSINGTDRLEVKLKEHRANRLNYPDCDENKIVSFLTETKWDQPIYGDDIEFLVKLCLREEVWCKLENTYMFAHFGYDYYMYVGSARELKSGEIKIIAPNLFQEDMSSPYR